MMLTVNQRNRRQEVIVPSYHDSCNFTNMFILFNNIFVASIFIFHQIGNGVQSLKSSFIVDGFAMIPNVSPNLLYQRNHQPVYLRILELHMNKDDSDTNDDENSNSSDEPLSMDLNDDSDDLLDEDDEDDEGNFDIDLSDDEYNEEDYDDDVDNDNNDSKDSLLEEIYSFDKTDIDVSVQQVLQEYMETYQSFMNKETSSSMKKANIIQGWLPAMKNWETIQYNQLLNELSRIGSVHDTETILYHMIDQQQQKSKEGIVNVLANDETFYHVFASYQYQQQQEHTKKNYKNKKYRGIAYKVEQLLAIQDAIYNNTNNNNNIEPILPNTILQKPSVRTLHSVLNVMILDRFDNKIALRAGRIWDRLLSHKETENKESVLLNAVVLVLICCTHVPRMTVSPIDKLSSFTVALDCFNWATASTTTTTTTSESTTRGNHVQQQCNVYTYFLRACRTLLDDTVESKRDAVIEAAFRRACINGYVNNKVIKALEECASDALMLRLLGGFIEDGQELPSEWSRNCILSNELEASVTVSNER
jgi:hypothetical protein